MASHNGITIPTAPLEGYTPELLEAWLFLLFGNSGIGKSEFLSKIPGILVVNFEGENAKWIRGTCPVLDVPERFPWAFMEEAKRAKEDPKTSFEWWMKAVLSTWGKSSELSVIGIDTLDTYYTEWGDYQWNRKRHGELFAGDSDQLYGRDYKYLDFILTQLISWVRIACDKFGKTAVFTCHEAKNEPQLNLPGNAPKRVLAAMDLVGRAKATRNGTRVIDFVPKGRQETKIRHPQAMRIAATREIPLSWDSVITLLTEATDSTQDEADPLEVDDADSVDNE